MCELSAPSELNCLGGNRLLFAEPGVTHWNPDHLGVACSSCFAPPPGSVPENIYRANWPGLGSTINSQSPDVLALQGGG